MSHEFCQQGCYPVDKKWHGGGLKLKNDADIKENVPADDVNTRADLSRRLGKKVYDGSGAFVIDDIVDFRRYCEEFGAGAGEKLLQKKTPDGQPYMRGAPEETDTVKDKKHKRSISASMIGQGADMEAYATLIDNIDTHYKYGPVVKVVDWVRPTPNSQVHNEFTQRRQQAEQQINRTLSSIADMYQQKQLLEHDLRKLRARKEHVEEGKEAVSKGYEGFEDELKADFVDVVDQHTGRSSILQMQANNIFPSITADFYSMSSLEDLRDGHLKHLPENEKAVLRKKWKLYEQWKDQFQTAVRSKYTDVKRRLNSVEKSIEMTEKWLRPYVQDIIQMDGDFEDQLDLSVGMSGYMPEGYSNLLRHMKVIAAKDVSPADSEGAFYDVVVMEVMKGSMPDFENPAATGQGLTIFKIWFYEYTVCKHVYDAVFGQQIEDKKNEVKNYIAEYIGEDAINPGPEEMAQKKDEIREQFDLSDDQEEELADIESIAVLQTFRRELEWEQSKPSMVDRIATKAKIFVGETDEYYHPDPSSLSENLVGPGFPTGYLLDYKYGIGMFVTK